MVTRRPLRAGDTFTPPATWALTGLAMRVPFWTMPGLIERDADWVPRTASTAAPCAGEPARVRAEAVRAVAQVSAVIAVFKGDAPRRRGARSRQATCWVARRRTSHRTLPRSWAGSRDELSGVRHDDPVAVGATDRGTAGAGRRRADKKSAPRPKRWPVTLLLALGIVVS